MIARRWRRARASVAPVAGLLLLSLLESLGRLRADLLPNLTPDLLPHLETQALQLAMLAIAATAFSITREAKWLSGRQIWNPILTGFGLFVAPAALAHFSAAWASGLTQAALFTLTPVFAVVFEPYLGARTDQQSRGALLAALTAVIGTLFVVPVRFPNSIESAAAFGAVVLAAACMAAATCQAVRAATDLAGNSAMPMAAIAGAAAVAGLAATSALTERPVWRWEILAPELAWSAIVELPALLLLFWLMRQLSAARMTTRYVLSLLMPVLIGAAMLREALSTRTCLGLLLMAAGAGYLLIAPDDEAEQAGLSLH